MVEKTPFQRFIELINFDQKVASLEQQLDNLQQEVVSLEKKEIDSSRNLDVLRRAVHDAQKNVDLKELEMKSLESADQEKRERLKGMTGQKEYKSLKIEIDRVHQKQHTLEQELLGVWKQLESSQKLFEEKSKSSAEAMRELQETIRQKRSEIETLIATVAQHVKIRPEKQQMIPAEWLEKYVMMRTQVDDPVVPVQNGSCSACFYKVTDNDMQQLRHNKLMQCKDCYRFLYLHTLDGSSEEMKQE